MSHNGHNGSNGHGGHPPGPGDITLRSGFRPTQRMVEFRLIADELWDPLFEEVHDLKDGIEVTRLQLVRPALRMVAQVVRWARKERLLEQRLEGAEAVTITEFKSWERLEGFNTWWEKTFPEVSELTETDIRIMDHAFWDATIKGMLRGDSKHSANYAKARALMVDQTPGDDSLKAYRESHQGNGWKTPQLAEA